jgi:hypothetical protein
MYRYVVAREFVPTSTNAGSSTIQTWDGKAVEISAHNFFSEQSFTSKQPCRPKSAPTAAIQQYPPSRVATTSSRITLRLSEADSTTEMTEAIMIR